MFKNKKIICYRNFVLEWLEKRKGFVKESTYANYGCIIYNHLITRIGNLYLWQIDNEILQELIIHKCQRSRIDGKGWLSNKSIRDIVSVLKSSIRYAVKNKLMNYVDLEFYYPNNSVKGKLYVFSKREQKKIIDYTVNRKKGKDIGIALTLYTGLRIGEICALKWGDINFKKNYLVVNKTIQRIYMKNDKKNERKSKVIITTPKTRNAIRMIPINYEFAKFFERIEER